MKYLLLLLLLTSSSFSVSDGLNRNWNEAKEAAIDAYHTNKLSFKWEKVSDQKELEQTWEKALVYLPQSAGGLWGELLTEDTLLKRNLSVSKYPVILYIHSCTGFAFHREDMLNLSKLGFVVIAPNSFARDYRPMGCFEDGEILTRYADLVTAFQNAELEYAVRKLRELDWVDQDKQYLYGSGMLGGMVVAQYAGNEFKGHVIEGWGCHSPIRSRTGIWAPKEVNIFAVVSSNDPWYREDKVSGYQGDCGEFLAERVNSKSIVLDCPCHYVSWYPEARPSLIEFLMHDLGIEYKQYLNDDPEIVYSKGVNFKLKRKWSIEAVYKAANTYCSTKGKKGYPTGPDKNEIYPFVCD